jgi:ATP-binding cassette subfamily B protein
MLMSLMMITNIFNTLVRAKASGERIEQVFNSDEDITDGEDVTAEIDHLDGSLHFQNVTFTYPGSNIPAIKDLSFFVSPGETLAVIGSTGSGKTTVCWLVLRFYDVDSGIIKLGGYDICDLPIETIRSNTSIAPQKPLLFTGTVTYAGGKKTLRMRK